MVFLVLYRKSIPLNFELYHTVSIAAVISYFVPLLLVLAKKLWSDPFFLWFALYWSWGGLINMMDVIPGFPSEVAYVIAVINNMLDVPFILAILYCTASSALQKKSILSAIVAIVALELVSIGMNGLNFQALKYPVGLGILSVLMGVSWEIVRYARKLEHSNRQNAKIFIYAALLFEYGTFTLIYIFDYFIVNPDPKDSFLIYYISTLVAILIASCGYLLFKKYKKKEAAAFIRE